MREFARHHTPQRVGIMYYDLEAQDRELVRLRTVLQNILDNTAAEPLDKWLLTGGDPRELLRWIHGRATEALAHPTNYPAENGAEGEEDGA